MNWNFITILIGQVARRVLTLAAAYLGYIGVTTAQQGNAVEALVPVAVAAVLFLADMIWAYFSKASALEKDPSKL